MVRRVIVTGGNAAYFPLIDELCASVRSQCDESRFGLAVINAGLEPEQAEELHRRYGARILEVGWGYEIPERRIRGREHLKVQIARAFLDQYVPDADLIAWLDADAWVQDLGPVQLAFDAAEKGPLAIVAQSSRYSDLAFHVDWAALGFARVRSILYKNARRARLPERLARQIGDKHTLNSGFFVLRRDAPHWAAWRARQAQIIHRGRIFTSDQLSLGLAIHVDGHPVELLPELCNYMGPWCCSEDETRLVERYVPNAAVGVVHMAGENEMRRSLDITIPIRTLDGRTIHKNLRRPAWVSAT